MTYETSGPYVAVKRAIDESGYGMITGWPKITIKAVDAQLLLMQISLLERQAVELKARVEAIQALVNEQAEDEALWTTPIKQVGEHWITNETVQEHLLKQALRGLLHTIKGEQHE